METLQTALLNFVLKRVKMGLSKNAKRNSEAIESAALDILEAIAREVRGDSAQDIAEEIAASLFEGKTPTS